MSRPAPDPSRCPLCGEANQCGMAAGSTECWCFGVTVSEGALERLPSGARGKVCICARCAKGGAAGEAEGGNAGDVVGPTVATSTSTSTSGGD